MNQGRIWCVVSPTVGLPLLLGSVAVTSLIVHACVLSHTTWYGGLYEGSKGRAAAAALNSSAASVASLTSQAQPGFSISVNPVAATPGKAATAFVVTVTPNQVQTAQAAASPHNVALAAAK